MSIRLVSGGGDVLWLTQSNWQSLLAFAEQFGWRRMGRLLPDEWGDALTFDRTWEIVGGAALDDDDARELAEAVDRGLRQPQQQGLRQIVDARNAVLQQAYPGREFTVEDLAGLWSEFVTFARKGGLRIDLTD